MVLRLFCNQVTAVRFCHGAPIFAAVAHQVEQQTENLCVAGSSPARGTKFMCESRISDGADVCQ